jgi:hypothetical protein
MKIHERTYPHNHDGKRSETRRIQSALSQLREWRSERIVAHEEGHNLETNPTDQEIVLFQRPLTDEERLEQARQELEDIKYSAQFDGQGEKY